MVHTKTLTELQQDFAQRKLSPEEVFAALGQRIEEHDGEIGAFLSTFTLSDAEGHQEERSSEESQLSGLPVAIKDNLCLKGTHTTCASKMLESFVSPYTATSVAKLLDQGMLPLGKTNLDEFAMGSSTENSSARLTRNPWNTEHAPGGSSGGSAAAVAAGFVPAALGSDTGGSIRQPAAFCGVVGLKPTYGRVSRYGLVAFASSLDQVGTFARSVEDTALLLSAMCGKDRFDATSLDVEAPGFDDLLGGGIDGLKLGLPKEYFPADGLDEETRASIAAACAEAEQAGASQLEVSLPHTKYAVAAYYILATAEASSNLARYDGVRYGHCAENVQTMEDLFVETRSQGFGPEVKRRIMLGTYVLSAGYYDAYYRKGQQVRRLIAQDFEEAFKSCDVMVAPVTPSPAFKLGERTDDPLSMYLSDIYTLSVNLAGLPAMSLPCGKSKDGLPLAVQLIAPPLREDLLLRVAAAIEERVGCKNMLAPLG